MNWIINSGFIMPNLTNPTFLYELSLGLFRALARGGGRCHAYSFMVLEDMMQTGIAWSLLSNCKRTFSQLLRNENILYQENIQQKFKFSFQTQPRNHPSHLPFHTSPFISQRSWVSRCKEPKCWNFFPSIQMQFPGHDQTTWFVRSIAISDNPT